MSKLKLLEARSIHVGAYANRTRLGSIPLYIDTRIMRAHCGSSLHNPSDPLKPIFLHIFSFCSVRFSTGSFSSPLIFQISGFLSGCGLEVSPKPEISH